MKKITLLLLFFFSLTGYSQLTEGFESGLPTGWIKMNAPVGSPAFGIGTTQQWMLNTTPNPVNPSGFAAHTGQNAALIQVEQIGGDNTEEDWLITSQQLIPANGQLRFFTRQTFTGDQGTIYEVRASLNPIQDNQSAFAALPLATWTESDLQDLNGDITQYVEKTVSFPASYQNQMVYIAFIRTNYQDTNLRDGDRWLIDDVRIRQACIAPNGLDIVSTTATGATFTFANPGLGTNFEIEIVTANGTQTGTGFLVTAPGTNPTTYQTTLADITLLPSTCYRYYVRAVCGTAEDPILSTWGGPFPFCTLPLGAKCADPIVVGDLPFQAAANTANFGDFIDMNQGPGCLTPNTTNYLAGNEVFYSYTPTVSGTISILMTPSGTPSGNSSLFVYQGCANVGVSCLAAVANAQSTPRLITLTVTEGTTYLIVISSSAANQTVAYNLLIQREECSPKPTGLAVSDQQTTTARLTWVSTEFAAWEVAVQDLGEGVPDGAGVYTTNNFYDPTGLTAGTQYEFWVRAECAPGSGVFTAWAGPFVFNTKICEDDQRCNYTFTLRRTGGQGWGANRMQVKQGEIVVAELGSTFTTGTSAQVTVPLCPGVPFSLFWNVGANANQIGVEVVNSFGQTLFTRPTGSGTTGVGTTLYTNMVNCTVPECNIPPINVNVADATIGTTTATVTWTAPATTAWDIIVLDAGSPAPSNTDVIPVGTPGYFPNVSVDNVNTPSYTFPDGTLEPEHAYDVYVRVRCDNPGPSAWSTKVTFTTDPTCFKPTAPIVIAPAITSPGATTASATFSWTAGLPEHTQWEILVIAGPNPPAVAPDNPTPATYTNITATTFTATDLLPATIYYAYVRTVCSPTDASIWVPFTVFNTDTCFDTDRCNYKFVLSNPSGTSWNGGRMQVRQNGIIIAVLGATNSQINDPIGVSVPLCPGVPFDLFWSVPGTAPQNIGVSVQNPFLDTLFTKAAGQGAPLTVLYEGVTNCTPAACSKPINPMADPEATTVTLTWGDISIPVAPAYDVYLVETLDNLPAPNDATVPTHPNVPNAVIIGGLEPSTSYTYYVRSVCSPTASSPWTYLTPVTFITEPLNDECADATLVTVNPSQTCLSENLASGNTYGSTASLPILDPPLTGVGCGATNNEVWYKFVATASSQTLILSNVVLSPAAPTTGKLNYSLYSGDCGTLSKLFCNTTNTMGVTGLTTGSTYYVRVYMATNTAQSATFNLCIISPPTNDECANAVPVPVNTGQTCLAENNVSGNTLGSTASTPISVPPLTAAACGASNNDIWYSFVATATSQTISISNVVPTPATATTLRLNYTVFAGNCSALESILCSNTNTNIAKGLTIGNTYYIRVYTATINSEQSATFDLCITSPPANDECINAITAAVNTSQNCEAVTPGNTLGATASLPVLNPVLTGAGCGALNNDIWYRFTASSQYHMISLRNIVPTPATANVVLNYSVFSGSCTSLTRLYCSTAATTMTTALTVGETYYIRVYTSSATVVDQSATFDLCITSPPVNDECVNSTPVTINESQDCLPANIAKGNTYGATASNPISAPVLTGPACGPTSRDLWYSFVATHTSHAISLSNIVRSPLNSNLVLNHTVFSGTCSNLTRLYCATTNSSNATGLTIGDTYYVRVFSTNNAVDQSATFDLCITAPPVNDECANALPAPVNPAFICNDVVYGSTLGATLSTPTITGQGCTGTNDDIWYTFTATNPVLFLNVNVLTASSGSVALNHTVFSGECGALTQLYCSQSANSVATNLTVGNVYYVRIYTAGTTVGDWATFSMCIKTPPPPAENEDCSSAIAVVVNTTADCTNTTFGNIIEAGPSTGTPNTPACTGNANDDVWFSFVATADQHFINLLNVEGTSTNLNHAVYTGSCGALTRVYCSDAGELSSTDDTFVPGQTYFLRVWSNSPNAQITTFDVCIKSISTCETATPFCGSAATQSLIFPNTTDAGGQGQVVCLFTTPNPTFYYLRVQQNGNLTFEIRQSSDPNNFPDAGAPGLDVDYAAWGPFDSPQSCDQIAFDPCPAGTPCPNNTANPDAYPVPGTNIVDCSYDGAPVETFRITNAVAGQYYLLMITNFNGNPGFIKLFQSDFGQPGSGVSTNLCCDVVLDENIIGCGDSIILDAIADSESTPGSYQWYFNNGPIPGAINSTYEATASGLYRVVGMCGVNSDVAETNLTLLPAIETTTPADYVLCDGTNNDGMAPFDLNTLTSQVLGTSLNPADYVVTYHLTEVLAATDDASIDITNPIEYPNQTIYVRVERVLTPTCYEVVPVNLVVTPLLKADFDYEFATYCQTEPNPIARFLTGGVMGTLSAPSQIVFADITTGEIDLDASTAGGPYTITNTILPAGGCTPVPLTFDITIVKQANADFSYVGGPFCTDGGVASIQLANADSKAGSFTVDIAGLSINANTGEVTLATSTPGIYQVTNSFTDASQAPCLGDSFTFEIEVRQPITGSFSYESPSFCKSNTLEEIQVAPPTGGTYRSTGGLSIDSNTGTIDIGASTSGVYTVTYEIVDADPSTGCGGFTTSTQVTINPEFAVTFESGCENNFFILRALPVNGSFDPLNVDYDWSGTGAFEPSGPTTPEAIRLKAKGTFKVIVTDKITLCTSELSFEAEKVGCVIQRGISPNNNGENDKFDLSAYDVKHISIYNRYGTEVYQLDNYTDQWFGQSNSGEELPDGTYFYVIDVANGKNETGWIYINR